MADPISRRAKGPTTPKENAVAFEMAKKLYRGHPAMIRKMRRLILEGKSLRLGKCDDCPERATVEVTELRKGQFTSRQYCDECAAKSGVAFHGWALRAARRERLTRARAMKKAKTAAKKPAKSKAKARPAANRSRKAKQAPKSKS